MFGAESDAEKPPKVVVGLGNPGAKYDGTRHNVGFEVLKELSQRLGAPTPRAKFDGQLAVATLEGNKVILLWPLTYMNDSGRCVQAVTKFYKIDVEQHLLVVCDDMSLPLGKLRIRAKGSDGGQKGLRDILRVCGSQSIARLRVGIDPPPPRWDVSDYVLGRFQNEDEPIIRESIRTATEAVLTWCAKDLTSCMNEFN